MEGHQFSDLHRTASSTTGDWSRWNVSICFLLYIILSTTVSFLDLMPYFFLQSLSFVHISFSIGKQDLFSCCLLIMNDVHNYDKYKAESVFILFYPDRHN